MKHLVKLEDFMEAINDKRLVVVDFYAQWCGPCKRIAPILVDMAEEFKDDAVFYKVDVDKADKEVTIEINAMPTFIFYRGGKQLDMLEGANPKKLHQIVENLTDTSELPESDDVEGGEVIAQEVVEVEGEQ
jgi:thioredoxin